MYNQQYVTITHYKEREFYFLNHAIQTNDGFISKDIEQFHESEKDKFIERIRELQTKYPKHQIISLSLMATQVVKEKEDPNQACARIFKDNYVIQEKLDIGNIPVTLYFSPFALLYEEYKDKLDEKLTLTIGYFDRKLYIMFVTKDKIHESWIIGTRGLTEKQIANRVYKSMKAYYKISYKFADHVEMLVSDDSPKLLKVLREELSMSILPTQKTIHNLLHHMGAEQSRFVSSYIKSFLSSSQQKEPMATSQMRPETFASTKTEESLEDVALNSLDDIRLNNPEEGISTNDKSEISFINRVKALFSGKSDNSSASSSVNLISFLPLFFVFAIGGYFSMQNSALEERVATVEAQSYAQTSNSLLAMTSEDVFNAMGKSAELKLAIISNSNIELKGVVWGIEPLRNALNALYSDGKFIITPLENFMTEFSFKSKV